MSGVVKGIIVAVVALAVVVALVVGALIGAGVLGWKAAQRAGNEAATLQDMKTIAAVEIQYYNTHSRTFGMLAQLIKEKMLTSKFSGDPPAADGYLFKLNIILKTSSQQTSYTLNADPVSDSTGKNHFYSDSNSSTIHVNPDRPASAIDPALSE